MMSKASTASIVGLILAASIRVAAAAPYTFTTFDVPGGTGTVVLGINDAGQLVGTYTAPSDPVSHYSAPTAFFDDVATGVISTVTYGFQTLISDVNSTGQIAGLTTISGSSLGIQRNPVTGALTIGGTGETGINDARQLVGYIIVSLHPGSELISILTDPVKGNSSIIDPSSPYFTLARDINNRGQVVGFLGSASFLLDIATSTYTTLNIPGSLNTNAEKINDNGQIVGSYQVGTTTSGFLLDLSTGQYTTIDAPGATSTFVEGINNAGDIVGSYTDSNGVGHGFIAAPSSLATVPEPTSLALLGGSVCVLAWARRRERSRPA